MAKKKMSISPPTVALIKREKYGFPNSYTLDRVSLTLADVLEGRRVDHTGFLDLLNGSKVNKTISKKPKYAYKQPKYELKVTKTQLRQRSILEYFTLNMIKRKGKAMLISHEKDTEVVLVDGARTDAAEVIEHEGYVLDYKDETKKELAFFLSVQGNEHYSYYATDTMINHAIGHHSATCPSCAATCGGHSYIKLD